MCNLTNGPWTAYGLPEFFAVRQLIAENVKSYFLCYANEINIMRFWYYAHKILSYLLKIALKNFSDVAK